MQTICKLNLKFVKTFLFCFSTSIIQQDESIKVDEIKNEFEKILDDTESKILEDAGYKMEFKNNKNLDIGTRLQKKADEDCKGKLIKYIYKSFD